MDKSLCRIFGVAMSIFSFNIIDFQVKGNSFLSLSLFIFIILLQSPQAFG